MSRPRPDTDPGRRSAPDGCACERPAPPAATGPVARDEGWSGAARLARRLAWASLAWMTVEGVVGLVAGLAADSTALVGWALGSAIEGLASVVVVWRFTGARTLSATAERRAQRVVALSFWLLVPYIGVEAVRALLGGAAPAVTVVGIVLTTASLLVMPGLGVAKHRLGRRLGSVATAGEGTQNLMCAAQAAAVLTGLALTALTPTLTWVDPAVALLIAAWSGWEGRRAWRGEDCC